MKHQLLLEKIKEGTSYFLYYPDKTQVIISVYILNPLFKFLEKVIFFIIDFIRVVVLKLLNIIYKIKK